MWVAFSPALKNGFVDWDDQTFIVQNTAFQGLGWEQVAYAFTTFSGGLYQPLGWLAQSLTYALFGLDPWGYHLTSLLVHSANVILLHLLCMRILTRSMPEAAARLGGGLGWICALPVLLYAVHPLRVEPVAWASCQAYLPGAALSLLATLAYLRTQLATGGRRLVGMIGVSVLVVLAVLTKGSAVVLPFVFLVLDAYPLGRLGPQRPTWLAVRPVLIEKLPMLVFCLAFTLVAARAKQVTLEAEATVQPVFAARVAQASFGAWFYLEKTVWPFGIAAFYPRPAQGNYGTPLFGACVLALVAAVAVAIRVRRRWPFLVATLAAYLIIAAPCLGMVQVGRTLAADRYSYLPMMPWVVLGCAGLCKLARGRWGRLPSAVGAGGALAVIGGLMVLCSAQCRVWDRCEHLWSQALARAEWSSTLHVFLGESLADEGKPDRAIAEFRTALRLDPASFEANYHLGQVFLREGATDAAVPCLREAARLRPSDARVYLGLGAALLQQGRADEAVAVYRAGLRVAANVPYLHCELGQALLRQRNVDEAIRELQTTVELQPRSAEAYDLLGSAFVLKGRLDDAVAALREALRLDPNRAASRINLGMTLARLGRTREGLDELREVVERDPDNANAHQVLGSLLVKLGRIDAAVAEFEETLRIRPDSAQARAFLAMAKRGRM